MTDTQLFEKIEEVIGFKPDGFTDKVRYALEDAYDKAQKEQLASTTGAEFTTNKGKYDKVVNIYSLFMKKITD